MYSIYLFNVLVYNKGSKKRLFLHKGDYVKLDSIKHFTKKFSALLKIPIQIIENDNSVFNPDIFKLNYNVDLSKKYWDSLVDTNKNVNTLLTPNLILFGSIKIQKTNYHMILGPCRSISLSSDIINKIILIHSLSLTSESELSRYFRSINQTSIEGFASILVGLNGLINDEVIENHELYNESVPYDTYADIYHEVLDRTEQIEFENKSTITEYDFERQVLYFIRHGLKNQLFKHMSKGYTGRNSVLAPEPLRQYKNRCISLTTLVSRAAMEGGLDSDTAYELFDVYNRRIELASNIRALNLVQKIMLYDFAGRVENLHYKQVEDPTINRAIVYINENIHKKILAKDIAKILKINPGYLSVKFKKTTGVSLPNFINSLKIIEAKRLLLFTDKSLAEITYTLSFSSQSYFQNLFKKITGMTPKEYMKNPDEKDHQFVKE